MGAIDRLHALPEVQSYVKDGDFISFGNVFSVNARMLEGPAERVVPVVEAYIAHFVSNENGKLYRDTYQQYLDTFLMKVMERGDEKYYRAAEMLIERGADLAAVAQYFEQKVGRATQEVKDAARRLDLATRTMGRVQAFAGELKKADASPTPPELKTGL